MVAQQLPIIDIETHPELASSVAEVKQSGLPPVLPMTIAELVAMRPPWTGPTFTDEQI